MAENHVIKVTKLERRPEGSLGPKAGRREKTKEKNAGEMNATARLQEMANSAKEVFLLEWEGNKIPYGAVINGRSIGWTQHGLVTNNVGIPIGTYERMVEWGGDSGKEQKMLVFSN